MGYFAVMCNRFNRFPEGGTVYPFIRFFISFTKLTGTKGI